MPTPPRPPRAAKATPSKLAASAPLDHDALLEAVQRLMQPLATLSVARGLSYATAEELLKRAFVDAARAAQPDDAGQRLVSRISTAIGLNRREVTRITQLEEHHESPRSSPATQLFTRWLSDPKLKTKHGEVRSLPRQGPAPSFETLARSVTSDVHPRSLLDELCRLGLAREEDDTVYLVQRSFVPQDSSDRMLGFLGNNVGDHLSAAVANVVSKKPQHLEQAVFADELSQPSMDAFDALMRKQWQALLAVTAPELTRLIDEDRLADRQRDQRVRIGLYMYSEPMADSATAATPATDPPAVAKKKPAAR